MNRRVKDISRCFTSVESRGDVPPARFGHTMTAISPTKVILFGGATGDTGRYSITGDTYCLDLASLVWTKLDDLQSAVPSPRAAHAASVVESLQMVVYGGATGGGSLASDDLFLLDMRGGIGSSSWMIVPVIGSTPGRRYGHTVVFSKPYLIVFGGNTGNETVNDTWALNVERSPFTWNKIEVIGEAPAPRVYHSACLCRTGSASGMTVVFGGRGGDSSALNDSWGLRRHRNGTWDWVRAPYKSNSVIPLGRYQHSSIFISSVMLVIGGRTNQIDERVTMDMYDTETSEWTLMTSPERFRHASWAIDNMLWIHGGFEQQAPNVPKNTLLKVDTLPIFKKEELENPHDKRTRPLPQVPPRTTNKTPEIRLAANVHAKISEASHSSKIQNIPVDSLPEEAKRLGLRPLPPTTQKTVETESISDFFLQQLFRSSEWSTLATANFDLPSPLVLGLIQESLEIFRQEPSLLRLRAPLKVFGNLHGQFVDLLRHFETWGEPSEAPRVGDIESFDYLFLGDYVDRGTRSVETMLLLLALKVKHPDQFFLLRGHHEDAVVNSVYGLAEECRVKFGEDPGNSVYAALNELFEYLPLAAVIDDAIFAVHGGIGQTLVTIDQIERIPKPVRLESSNQLVVDLLWSDLCEDEQETDAALPSLRKGCVYRNVVKVGVGRIRRFLVKNSLGLLVRSHECAMEGLEQVGQPDVVTVFSATDYCGKYKNVGSFIMIKRTLEVVPKQIYPISSAANPWLEEDTVQRPITPPRWKSEAK